MMKLSWTDKKRLWLVDLPQMKQQQTVLYYKTQNTVKHVTPFSKSLLSNDCLHSVNKTKDWALVQNAAFVMKIKVLKLGLVR